MQLSQRHAELHCTGRPVSMQAHATPSTISLHQAPAMQNYVCIIVGQQRYCGPAAVKFCGITWNACAPVVHR